MKRPPELGIAKPGQKKWRTTSRIRTPPKVGWIVAFIQRHRGATIAEIAHHFKASRSEVRDRVRQMAARKLVEVDSRSRVFSVVVPDVQIKPSLSSLDAQRVAPKRSTLKERIEANRRSWIKYVEKCWLTLRANPGLWIENRDRNLRLIAQEIAQTADHYLTKAEVPSAIKEKARQVLDVFNAVRVARQCGSIDPWVFAPFRWPKVDIDHLEAAVSPSKPKASGRLLESIGYHVGKSGLGELERREILRDAMVRPVLINAEDLPPSSCGRLRRIAYAIAFEANTHKTNKRGDYTKAVAEWISDLEWMRINFYLGNCDFPWPLSD